jgi:hypothetical protein
MRVHTPFFVLFAAFLCGCSSDHFKTGHGDAGQFILQQALVCGAHPVATNSLPAIDGRWRYSVDTNGMVLQLPREQFSDVCVFLRQAFGSPEQEPVEAKDGKMGWYAAKTIGIAIQFGYDSKRTQVIVLRPQPMSKVMEIIMNAPQEKK